MNYILPLSLLASALYLAGAYFFPGVFVALAPHFRERLEEDEDAREVLKIMSLAWPLVVVFVGFIYLYLVLSSLFSARR